jgi:uncharacterized protein YdhG (YjbR/CyaY superfamily)
MNKKFKTVNEYLSSLPPRTKTIVKQLRKIIKETALGAEEFISYNIPAFKLNNKKFVWYAGWKDFVSIYPFSKKMEGTIKELSPYRAGKSTIKFPIDKPLPAGSIKKFIKYSIRGNS